MNNATTKYPFGSAKDKAISKHLNEQIAKLPVEKQATFITVRANLNDCVEKHFERLYDLKSRWQDEREYEDFTEYRQIFKTTFEQYGFTDVTVTKGFKVTVTFQNLKTTFTLNYSGFQFKYTFV